MVDPDRKLLFVHIARTGGTSIEAALVGKDWWKIDPKTKHMRASEMRKYYGEKAWKSFKKLTVVRNPWDRVVAMWMTGWWTDRPLKLKDFVETLKPHPHETALHYHEIIDEELDFILRFERLRDDFSSMLRALKEPSVVLPHEEKRVSRGHYRMFYDSESMALVGKVFEKDIQMFGYTF